MKNQILQNYNNFFTLFIGRLTRLFCENQCRKKRYGGIVFYFVVSHHQFVTTQRSRKIKPKGVLAWGGCYKDFLLPPPTVG